MIGKIALIMLVAAGLHCQIKLPAVGFLRCNKMPLRGHEMIYIFNNGNIDDIDIEFNVEQREYAKKVLKFIGQTFK